MVFHFESFQLDVAERRLLCAGEVVPLRAKVFDTLCILVENHGRLLRKDELMQRLWPDSVVEDNNLDHNISKLRSALQNGSNGQKFIETVPRQGYRFVANVRQISGSPAAQTVIPPPTADSPSEQEIQFFTTSDGVR
ncbi:MAG TPA: transcriptional regulator, partial [Candidatus Methylomirabilis sp.]|nr:transcriptional regulator [Candidatus Methylomirabilis sp.]